MASKIKNINIDDLVEKILPDPIRNESGFNAVEDARDFLKAQLKIYDQLLNEAPKDLRPKLTYVAGQLLLMATDGAVNICYKSANLPGKFYQLFEEYNKQKGIVPKEFK